MDFSCIIIGKFHAKNEKDPPYRFWPADTVHTDAQTHRRTDEQGASYNHPKFSIKSCRGVINHSLISPMQMKLGQH